MPVGDGAALRPARPGRRFSLRLAGGSAAGTPMWPGHGRHRELRARVVDAEPRAAGWNVGVGDANVGVGHERPACGSGAGIATSRASGNDCRASSSPYRRKPMTPAGSPRRVSGSPQFGQAGRYEAAAGVNAAGNLDTKHGSWPVLSVGAVRVGRLANQICSGVCRVMGREGPKLCEALAPAVDDHPSVFAAVVLNDGECDRCRRRLCSPSDLPGRALLLCCGGHGQPPLCPSG